MSAAEVCMLVVAGIAGGLAGSIAGLASIATYPALLAVGLAPVTANVTNTVSLVFGTTGSVSASRPELRGQGAKFRRVAIAGALGGAAGGTLLLVSPADSFERIVPWLVALGSVSMLARRRLVGVPPVDAPPVDAPPVGASPVADAPPVDTPPVAGAPPVGAPLIETPPAGAPPVGVRHHSRGLVAGTALVGVYGGYFGAGAGVMLLALLLHATDEALPRANAVKNVVLGLANGVAAVGFVLFGPVDWSAVVPLGIGLFIGGRIGPVIVRRVRADRLRVAIAIAGLALSVKLGIDAYG